MRKSDVMILVEGVGPAIASLISKGMESLRARLETTEKQLADALAKLAERPDVEALVAAAVEKALTERVPKEVAALELKIDGEELKKTIDDAIAGIQIDQAAVLDLVVAEVQKATSAIPMPKDGKDADPEVVDGMVKAAIADLMTPLQGAVDTAIADVRAVTDAAVAEMKEAIPTAAAVAALVPAGKDADPEVTRGMIAEAVAAVPPAKDGESVTPEQLRPLVDEVVAAKVAEIPPAPAGKDADPEAVRAIVVDEVKAQVTALPPPADGKDATPEAIDAAVAKHLVTWERPKDGKSVTIEEVLPALHDGLVKAVAALPAAKDGVGLAGLLIDSDGVLVGTLTDGSLHKLGPVRGKDGLGDGDFEIIDGATDFTVRLTRGEQVKEWKIAKPTLADMHKGIWREGGYKRGAVVTWGGSQWLALADTDAKPETTKDWTLIVKRGRDGKDLTPTEPKPPKPVKL